MDRPSVEVLISNLAKEFGSATPSLIIDSCVDTGLPVSWEERGTLRISPAALGFLEARALIYAVARTLAVPCIRDKRETMRDAVLSSLFAGTSTLFLLIIDDRFWWAWICVSTAAAVFVFGLPDVSRARLERDAERRALAVTRDFSGAEAYLAACRDFELHGKRATPRQRHFTESEIVYRTYLEPLERAASRLHLS